MVSVTFTSSLLRMLRNCLLSLPIPQIVPFDWHLVARQNHVTSSPDYTLKAKVVRHRDSPNSCFFSSPIPYSPRCFFGTTVEFFFHIPNLLNTIVRCGETGPLKQKLPKKKPKESDCLHAACLFGDWKKFQKYSPKSGAKL